MARLSLVALVLALAAPSVFALSNQAGHHGSHDKLARTHGSVNVTERGSTPQSDWKLTKRFDGARCTNYAAGLGACGQTNSASDFIVALNTEQYGSGEHCFETITITYNGKSTQAQIMDRCAGCPFGAIDLTESLFQFFAPLDQGEFYASWNFGSGKTEPSTTSSPPPPPSPTSTWTPESTSWSSTSTWSSSSSTSTWSSSSNTSTSSSTSTSSTSTSSSTSATASATSGPDSNSVLDVLDYAVVQLGGLISGAMQVNLETTESS
ncbi:hypothetical protein ACEPAI_684 [Sanghuangporus weigelae]